MALRYAINYNQDGCEMPAAIRLLQAFFLGAVVVMVVMVIMVVFVVMVVMVNKLMGCNFIALILSHIRTSAHPHIRTSAHPHIRTSISASFRFYLEHYHSLFLFAQAEIVAQVQAEPPGIILS